ncbi:hypothetical protein ACO0SA_002127 [Hanseniaspora valbyensis]
MGIKNRNTKKSNKDSVSEIKVSPSTKTLDETSIPEDKYAHLYVDKFDFITEMLCTDRLIQVFIIFMTCHLFYIQTYSDTNSIVSNNSSWAMIFNSLISFLCCLAIFIKQGSVVWTLENFDSQFFNLLYLYIIPMGLTFYFLPTEYLALTGTLVLNSLPISAHLRIPLMGIFMIFQMPDYVPDYYNVRFMFFKSILINYVFEKFLTIISGYRKSLSIVETNFFSILLTYITYVLDFPDSIPFQILQKSLYAMLTVNVIQSIWVFFNKFVFNNNKGEGVVYKLIGYSLSVASFPFFLYFYLNNLPGFFSTNDKNPFAWLVLFLTETDQRLSIISMWGIAVASSIPLLTSYVYEGTISLNFSRKYWHFLILLMIVLPWKVDNVLIKTSLAGVIPLFLLLESIRYCNFFPNWIALCLDKFGDHRDQRGPLLISYLYLIIGVSLPILIDDDITGLIVLGLGDSVASIIGKKYGKKLWADSNTENKKTYEGTFAFIVSCSIFDIIIKWYYAGAPLDIEYFQTLDLKQLAFSVANFAVAGLLEGNATLNDNILLPSYTMVLRKLLC